MEIVDPPLLRAIREVRWHLGAGHGMNEAVRAYLENNGDEMAARVRKRWAQRTQGAISEPFTSFREQAFWELLARGAAGQPTAEPLRALEDEARAAAESELELHVSTLPFKLLIPLLLFQFPAYLILLLGPMLRELTRQMGG